MAVLAVCGRFTKTKRCLSLITMWFGWGSEGGSQVRFRRCIDKVFPGWSCAGRASGPGLSTLDPA
jgi:hypothetical protein